MHKFKAPLPRRGTSILIQAWVLTRSFVLQPCIDTICITRITAVADAI